MIPDWSMISFYLAVGTQYNNEGNRDHGYDEERERAIQQLNDLVREEELDSDAILFEEDYFYTQGKNRGKGKRGGKKGGRSTKSKFSENNLITFHKKNDQGKKKKKAKKTLNEERKYLHEATRPLETRHFKKGQEINLCPQELDTREQEKQFMTRKEIIRQKKNDEIECEWENMKFYTLQQRQEETFKNGKRIFLSMGEILSKERDFRQALRSQPFAFEWRREQEDLFENEKQIFLEEIETKERAIQEMNIQKQVIPLEIDLVNLTLAQEQIAQQIHEIKAQLDGWTYM